jgi:hypothetical protein
MKKQQDLQRQLDKAKARMAALENAWHRSVCVHVVAPPGPRHSLQSIADLWHGGSTAGTHSRHMRVNY